MKDNFTGRNPDSKFNKNNVILIAGFLVVLFGLTIASMINPVKAFSENENRILAARPEFSIDSLLSGKFTSDYEEFITDQFVFRDNWIGIKTISERAMLKQDINGVFFGKDGYLIEKHNDTDIDREQLKKNIDRLSEFVKKYSEELGDDRVKVMMIPTASDILVDKLPPFAPGYDQEAFIEQLKTSLNDPKSFVDVRDSLMEKNKEYIFYKTDHHWTSLGAYYAYEAWANAIGVEPWKQEDFNIEKVTSQFYGTIFSKVNTRVKPDDINLYLTKDNVNYELTYNLEEDKKKDTLYDMEQLEGKDKYSVFLGGNNAVVKISTTNQNDRKLLVIKDSFAHSFVPFAVNHYEETHMIDFRYFNMNISQYIEENDITDVLVLYNVINFAKDKNSGKLVK